MNDTATREQLILFSKQTAWQELPKEVREKTIDLVASLCLEIVMQAPPPIQEDNRELSQD